MPEWQASGLRLPSGSSSETCLAAATEVAIIAEKFLQGSTALTNPQFAFCLFICGRMFLAHSAYYSVPLATAFDSLVQSLVEMSRRWNGPDDTADNLARKFARRLLRAREQGYAVLDLRQAVYSDDPKPEMGDATPNPGSSMAEMQHAANSRMTGMGGGANQQEGGFPDYTGIVDFDQDASPDSMSLAFPPLPVSFYHQQSSRGPTAVSSPVPGAATVPGMQPYDGRQGNMGGSAAHNFEDLSAYLDYSFLPTQRISMFSGQPEKQHQQQ